MCKIYSSYKCIGCSKEIILLTEQVNNTLNYGKYLSCSHCGCKKLKRIKEADNLKECMQARAYKRSNGAIREIK